jgi:FkbM family methyltransferase
VRDTWQLYDDPVETPLGFKMVGNSLMQTGEYEPQETQIAIEILPHVDVFINIGANIGYYCCVALHYGKQHCHIVAFEPIYHNLFYLLQNIKINHWESRVEIYPVALSNKPGVIEIFGGGPQASLIEGWGRRPDQYVTLVPASTLDSVIGSRFQGKQCFVIVDIEGAEQMMLEGAQSFVNQHPKPVWMIEVSISEHQPEGVIVNPKLLSTFHFFWNRGYESWTADRQCRPVYPDEIERVATGGTDTFSTHNFLFVERGRKNEFLNI